MKLEGTVCTFSVLQLLRSLDKEEGKIQVSSLLYAMGPEADKMIFSQFTFDNEEGRTDFDVVSLFDQHFLPKRNIIHERAQFFRRK